jgi:hypothetical protein
MTCLTSKDAESICDWMRSAWRLPAASVKGNSVRSAIYSPDGHRGRHVSYRPLRVYQSGRENRYRNGRGQSPEETRRISVGDAWRTRAMWRKRAQPASSASQPHEFEALRARVGHSKVAHERDESALSMVGAARTDGGGPGVDGGDAQRPACLGTGNHGGT